MIGPVEPTCHERAAWCYHRPTWRATGWCGRGECASAARTAGVVGTGQAYTVQPGAIRALGDEARAHLTAWGKRDRESLARIDARPPAYLSPDVEKRAKRLTRWANGWRRSRPQGATMATTGKATGATAGKTPSKRARKAGAGASQGGTTYGQEQALAMRQEIETLRNALALATRELDTLRRVVGAAEGIRAWAIATARDVDGLVSDPAYQPAETWQERRQALSRLTDA